MQASISRRGKSCFVLLLAAVAAIIIAANHLGVAYAAAASNFLNLAITVPLLVVSVALLVKDGTGGDFGKSWLCFTIFVALWFVAERIWFVHYLLYQSSPWPSEADAFWIAGYPAYFVFAAFYLRPFKSMVSRKVLVASLGVAAVLASFLAHHTDMQGSDLSGEELLLGISYPIADAISLFPIIMGLVLFLRGQVQFLWTCLFIGMLLFVMSDYGFLFLSLDDSYYTGSYVDIPYLWAYLFFALGAYSHLSVFRGRGSRFNDQERMR